MCMYHTHSANCPSLPRQSAALTHFTLLKNVWSHETRRKHRTLTMFTSEFRSDSGLVGLGGLEPPTSPLSGVRSNHLSYRPGLCTAPYDQAICVDACARKYPGSAFKEVIQPQVPLRLPCYDFTPVIGHTVVSALLAVKLPTSGAVNSHGVTGGVYKARERIHRDILIRDY